MWIKIITSNTNYEIHESSANWILKIEIINSNINWKWNGQDSKENFVECIFKIKIDDVIAVSFIKFLTMHYGF